MQDHASCSCCQRRGSPAKTARRACTTGCHALGGSLPHLLLQVRQLLWALPGQHAVCKACKSRSLSSGAGQSAAARAGGELDNPGIMTFVEMDLRHPCSCSACAGDSAAVRSAGKGGTLRCSRINSTGTARFCCAGAGQAAAVCSAGGAGPVAAGGVQPHSVGGG